MLYNTFYICTYNNNNIYFIEIKHTIQIASQYKETAQLDTEKGIACIAASSTYT
jgi:hypothetical protein